MSCSLITSCSLIEICYILKETEMLVLVSSLQLRPQKGHLPRKSRVCRRGWDDGTPLFACEVWIWSLTGWSLKNHVVLCFHRSERIVHQPTPGFSHACLGAKELPEKSELFLAPKAQEAPNQLESLKKFHLKAENSLQNTNPSTSIPPKNARNYPTLLLSP